MFYIQNTFKKEYDFSFVKDVFKDFPNTKKEDFDEFTQKSLDYIKKQEITVFDYLEVIQAYFTEMIALNYENYNFKNKILYTIENVLRAKKYILSSIRAEYVLDDLWVNIS